MTKTKSLLSADVDLLNGSIMKSLVIFSIPLFISNIFQQLYSMVDTMIVGHFLGDNALAAIGSTASINELLIGFGLGIGNGLAVVTARSFGSGDEKLLKKSVAASIVIGLISSLAITVIGSMALYPLLDVLKTPQEIIAQAYSYISWIVWFTIVMFAYNLCAGLLRAIGNSFMPLVFLIISSVVNVVLDIVFIAVFSMGVTGAAVATVISQGISVVLCIVYILKKVPLLIPCRDDFAFDRPLYGELTAQGMSMGFMSSIVSAGSVILQYSINGLGTLVIAGHTTARKVFVFFAMPFSTMSVAVSTFVSQNRGANKIKRIRLAMKYTYIFDIVVAAVMTVVLLFTAEGIIAAVSGSQEYTVLHNGAMYIIITGPFYSVLGVLLATRYALQGIGEKVLPLFSSVIEFVGKIVFVLVFIPKFDYMAVILCEPVIWCFMALQLTIAFFTNPIIKKCE
ncbi:MAG: MATE family efflux transporter [Oscillospiraceae bacterium]|nr:MATE family efflux transporter [Oscillospiraceae bacterium]